MGKFLTRKRDKQVFPVRKKVPRDAGSPQFLYVDKRQISPLKIKSNRLPVQISIIVPETLNNKKISSSAFQKRIDNEKRFFSRNFGGDTSIKTVGGYVMPVKTKKGIKEKLIKEKGTLVESSTTPSEYKENKKLLENHIKKMQKKWKQDTVLYNVEGETYLYPRKTYIAHYKGKEKISVT